MNIVTTWIVYIFLFLFFAMIVVFNVARVVYFIKCFKIKSCCKKSCRFKIFCYKYYEKYTDEDIARILKMLDNNTENEKTAESHGDKT